MARTLASSGGAIRYDERRFAWFLELIGALAAATTGTSGGAGARGARPRAERARCAPSYVPRPLRGWLRAALLC